MTTEIKSIICDRSHLEDINKIIEPHSTMYGVNIVYSGLKEIHKNTIRHILNNPFSLSKVVATVTDKIDCFAVYVPWQGLPFYTASFMYYSFAKNDIGNFFHHGIKLMEKMTEIGEEDNRFEYYYMIRDRQYDRVEKTWSLNESMYKRYEVINMEYLKPGQISKYSTFNSLFSGVIGQQKKPVMIRKAQLRKEYRLPLS